MNTYPAFWQTRDSKAVRASGQEVARATNGRLHVRRLWSADRSDFDVGHVLDAQARGDLNAFYAANKDADITFRFAGDGQLYTVRFVAPPNYIARLRVFEARVQLAEV